MPNLMQILSIFLKLQAVKQSGPVFLAYPVYNTIYSPHGVDKFAMCFKWRERAWGERIVHGALYPLQGLNGRDRPYNHTARL